MLVPYDRFSHVAGICADRAIPGSGHGLRRKFLFCAISSNILQRKSAKSGFEDSRQATVLQLKFFLSYSDWNNFSTFPVGYAAYERAAGMTRAEEYRRLARECLEAARTVQNEEGRTALLQMAQVWQRLADEQEDANRQFDEGKPPPAAGSAQQPAQQQQQVQPKDDDKKE
jgi:hypothetical protein